MINNPKYYLGIDCGAISLNLAILDDTKRLIWRNYQRTHGDPLNVLKRSMDRLFSEVDIEEFEGITVTGSARQLIVGIVDSESINEITAHGLAGAFFYPDAKSIIEIGGQDSKLIFLDKNTKGETIIVDSAMNDICAAGTGSFLEQQAFRMGISIEELSEGAYRSVNPAKIAGRCSVFAKTDMIHLQQEGVPINDLSAGLCYALARTYLEIFIKGRKLKPPILFQGGVAANIGMKKAFTEVLNLNKGDIIVPPNFDIMGAIGCALYVIKKGIIARRLTKESLREKLCSIAEVKREKLSLPRLSFKYVKQVDSKVNRLSKYNNCSVNEVYIGIDVGSVSTKIAVIDEDKNLIYKHYTSTHGKPLEAVKICLNDFREYCNGNVKVKGVGVTGSGRSFIANFIGADIVKNEITAQATATVIMVQDVDTIIEIGGQDSKYIRINKGTIVDFVMNKTCAAGTGSFLSEQADRLQIDLNQEYSDLAIAANNPVDMGNRCTVFMESDCIHYQQNNTPKQDIVAGLSYSIAKNYLEKVVGNRPIGDKVVFQGGVAFNKSVAAAFGQILKKEIIIPPHHEISGALGIAYITSKEIRDRSSFVGFELKNRLVNSERRQCKGCANLCMLTRFKYNDGQESVHGSICGKFDKEKIAISKRYPDYFKKRNEILLSYKGDKIEGKEVIGIPRILLFYELFPMWATFFNAIGYNIEISNEYSKQIYEKGLSNILIDTCYPIKAVYGAIVDLYERGIQRIFLPYILNMADEGYKTKFAHNCQYVQQVPDFIKASMDIDILTHTIKMKEEINNIEKAFVELGMRLDISEKDTLIAIKKAIAAQREFIAKCKDIGRESLDYAKSVEKLFVLIGHPYIIHDKFFNLNLVSRLAGLEMPMIPGDILPLEESNSNVRNIDLIWKTSNRTMNVLEFIHTYNKHNNNRLLPIVATTFGCPADSMLTPYVTEALKDNQWLEIEFDEHNSLTGILTRCEAFWESMDVNKKVKSTFNIDKSSSVNITIRDIKREDRIVYILPVCESMIGAKEVFEKHSIKCKIIPKTTLYSNTIGRKFSNEKQCRTYQVILGDLLATAANEDFYPEKAAFLLFGYEEACRFSLFKDLYKRMLIKQGFDGIWVFGPVVDNPLDWRKHFGMKVALELWESFICYDYLSRYKYQIRPYEKVKGNTDEVYEKAKYILALGIRKDQLVKHFGEAMDHLKSVEVVDRDLVRIGIVGDAYTRVHDYGMAEIFAGIEAMGGVIILPPSWHDFISYGADRLVTTLWERRKYGTSAFAWIVSATLKLYKERIEKISARYSEMFPDQNNKWLTINAEKYVNPKVAPVIPSMFVGKCVDFVEKRQVDGLVNAFGFNCALGKLATVCFNRLRIFNQNIPMLTFVDDGLQQTNIKTRLEAFMEQAWAFKNKKNSNSLKMQ
ncbi:MAG: acyl-CoA dehydratase activase [bacterium]